MSSDAIDALFVFIDTVFKYLLQTNMRYNVTKGGKSLRSPW